MRVYKQKDGLGLVPQPIYSHGMVAEAYGARQSNALDEHDMTNIGGGEAEKHEEGDLSQFSPAMSSDNR